MKKDASERVKAAPKGVSVIDFFCIGFGAIVGVGWAVSINSWMAGSGGPIPAAVGYILALIIMIPVSLCYCELCSMLPVSGGGMSYAFRAFGDNVAFISGWAAFGAFITIIPWEAIYVVDILSIIFPVLKAGAPLYTLAGAEIYIGHIIVGTVISVLLFLINRKGVSASASLQRVLCFILVGAGILAMICSLIKYDTNNLQPLYENIGGGSHKSFFGGAMTILASAPFFLAGFETIPQGVESAGGKTDSVGKTVILTVTLSCIFYAALLATLGGALPWKEFADFEAPAAAILFKVIYPGGVGMVLYLIILIGAICGLITTWNGFMMASSQILMSMARVSIVPDKLAEVDPKYGTPTNALKVCLVASILGPFLGSGLIGSLTTFSAAGYVVSWAITAFCLIKLRKTEPELKRPYKIPGGPAMAWFAGLSMTALLILLVVPGQPVFMGKFATLLFVIWMLIGFILFMLDYRQRQRYSKLKRAAILFASMMGSDTVLPGYMNYFEEDYRVLSFRVQPDSVYVDQTLMDIGWGLKRNIYIIKIEHGTEIIMLPSRHYVLTAGDRVFALGSAKTVDDFIMTEISGAKHTITSLKDFMGFGETEKQAPITCTELKITEDSAYCGKLLKDSGIQSESHCMVVGIQKDGNTTLMPTAFTRIEDGDTLWVVGSDGDVSEFVKTVYNQ